MDAPTLLTFGLAFFVFAASPGPDNLTIISKTISSGPAYGLAYGLGVTTSIFMFVILASIGSNFISQYFSEHLRFVQYFGAAYLVYTGCVMWRSDPQLISRDKPNSFIRLFGAGFILNVSNPKMPIFYLALLPSVVRPGSMTVLATAELLLAIAVIEIIVIGGHLLLARKAKATFSDPSRMRRLNKGAGALMVGAGVLVASR